jgi:hypothetical protein
MTKIKNYCFDLDGTLCTQVDPHNYGEDADPQRIYELAKPMQSRIDLVNKLYDQGSKIYIDTARGTDIPDKVDEWRSMTEKQLAEWGVKYHVLRCGVKFFAEEYIDDRGHNADTWFPPETYTDDYGTWYSCNGEPVLD